MFLSMKGEMARGQPYAVMHKEQPMGFISGISRGKAVGKIVNFRLNPKLPKYGLFMAKAELENKNGDEGFHTSTHVFHDPYLQSTIGTGASFWDFFQHTVKDINNVMQLKNPHLLKHFALGYDDQENAFTVTIPPWTKMTFEPFLPAVLGFTAEQSEEFENETAQAKKMVAGSKKMMSDLLGVSEEKLVITQKIYPTHLEFAESEDRELTTERAIEQLNNFFSTATERFNLNYPIRAQNLGHSMIRISSGRGAHTSDIAKGLQLKITLEGVMEKCLQFEEEKLVFKIERGNSYLLKFYNGNTDLLRDIKPVYFCSDLSQSVAFLTDESKAGLVNLTAILQPSGSIISTLLTEDVPSFFASGCLYDMGHKKLSYENFDCSLTIDVSYEY